MVIYGIEVGIGEETYHGEMEILSTTSDLLSSIDYDKPLVEGVRRYLHFHHFGRIFEEFSRRGAKSNTNHHSTKEKLIHREGRLANIKKNLSYDDS